MLWGSSDDEVFYRGRGCDECNSTGYSGRMAVYELLRVTAGPAPPDRAGGDGGERCAGRRCQDGMVPLTAARDGAGEAAGRYRLAKYIESGWNKRKRAPVHRSHPHCEAVKWT